MAANITPETFNELVASGEDLCDGLNQHGAALGIAQNTFAATRADLDALIAKQAALAAAEGAQPAAYASLRSADSNAKGFIARAVKVLSVSLGNRWSAVWLATGMPDNSLAVPRTQDKRFATLGGLKAYFTAQPASENAGLNVTAALAGTLYEAVSDARTAVGNALAASKDALLARDAAAEKFRHRFRGTINELGELLADDAPEWYEFGLNRPGDPSTPGMVAHVVATPLGGGRGLVQIDGARRANSFNFYRQIVGVDPAPVKVINTPATQLTLENLPVGMKVEITVTGVNAAGEGQPNAVVSLLVT